MTGHKKKLLPGRQEKKESREKPMYELWFRAPYKDSLEAKEITVIIRPGDRRYPNPKGVRRGEEALVRVISKPGSEKANKQPIFDKFMTRVRVKKIEVKKLSELTEGDLKTCSSDCRNRETAKNHLESIYEREFNGDDLVSVIHFAYL